MKKMALYLAALSFFLAGCAAAHAPLVLDPSFRERGITKIALLPIVDRRRDRSANIDLQQQMSGRVRKTLEKKGYEVVSARENLREDPESMERLMEMDPQFITSLGPEDSDAVLVVYVDDVLSDYKLIVYTFKVESTATLVLKSDGTELWRDKGLGNQGQAGLISGAFQLWDRSLALDTCVSAMFSSLPRTLSGTSHIALRQSTHADSRQAAIETAVAKVSKKEGETE